MLLVAIYCLQNLQDYIIKETFVIFWMVGNQCNSRLNATLIHANASAQRKMVSNTWKSTVFFSAGRKITLVGI